MRDDICYGSALGHFVNVGRLSFIRRIRPYQPPDDDIYKLAMARSLPRVATQRHPSTLFDLASPAAL